MRHKTHKTFIPRCDRILNSQRSRMFERTFSNMYQISNHKRLITRRACVARCVFTTQTLLRHATPRHSDVSRPAPHSMSLPSRNKQYVRPVVMSTDTCYARSSRNNTHTHKTRMRINQIVFFMRIPTNTGVPRAEQRHRRDSFSWIRGD